MAEPVDIILPMLKEMRAEIGEVRSIMVDGFSKNEEAHKNFRNALSADTLMGRLLTGEFEERIEKLEALGDRIKRLETKVNALESRS